MSKHKDDQVENKTQGDKAERKHPRREQWIKGVQDTKGKYAKREYINPIQEMTSKAASEKLQSAQKETKKDTSFFRRRRSAPAAIGRSTSRRKSIEKFRSLTGEIKSDRELFGAISAKANRDSVIKEIEQKLLTKMGELTHALTSLLTEFGDIKSLEKKMARVWVVTDKLKDRHNELREICTLQRKLDKQIKDLLKLMEQVPYLVDEAIATAKKPYLSKHPAIIAAIKEELVEKARQQGREISPDIFDNFETDEQFFKLLDEMVESWGESGPSKQINR